MLPPSTTPQLIPKVSLCDAKEYGPGALRHSANNKTHIIKVRVYLMRTDFMANIAILKFITYLNAKISRLSIFHSHSLSYEESTIDPAIYKLLVYHTRSKKAQHIC